MKNLPLQKFVEIFRFSQILFSCMEVTCNGEELSLLECKYKTAVKCARSEVAGVKCSQRGGKYYLKRGFP